MASGGTSLTNANYHLFEPSPIETSLAAAVDDPSKPSAWPLLRMYQGQNAQSQDAYQQQVGDMRNIEQQRWLAGNEIARNAQISTSLKDASGVPGAAQIMQTNGVLPQGDMSQFNEATQQAATSKNAGAYLHGAGGAAVGGLSIPTSLTQAALGPQGAGVTQGAPAIVQAAGINAAGRVAAAGAANAPKVSIDGYTGVPTISGKLNPGESVDAFKVRATGETQALTPAQQVKAVIDHVSKTDPVAAANIAKGAAMNGGQLKTTVVNGRTALVGADGKTY